MLSNPRVIIGCVSPCGNELLVKSPRVLRPCIFDNPFCELNLDLGRNLCDTYIRIMGWSHLVQLHSKLIYISIYFFDGYKCAGNLKKS